MNAIEPIVGTGSGHLEESSVLKTIVANLMTAMMLAGAVVAQDPPIPKDTEIKTTESGLKYSVLAKGEGGGASPAMGDMVVVNYTGWLADGGKMFDRSKDEPASFRVGQVIEGWNEGLALMVKGDKFKFTIPSALAYGESGRPGIPPSADLIFVVELVDFIAAPRMPKIDPEKSVVTESGLQYVLASAGEGETCGDDHIIVLDYVFWQESGALVGDSDSGGPVTLNKARPMQLKMFGELRKVGLKPGAVIHAKCPPELLFGERPGPGGMAPNTTTVWRITVKRAEKPRPAPDFVKPDAEKQIVTESGLKYEILTKGEGASPSATDTCTVHYAGWLTDGTLFDSSYPRGEAASFPLNRVIAGWTEGVQLMKVGSKYRFEIPWALAYGEAGRPPTIPAKADLIFVVELLEIDG